MFEYIKSGFNAVLGVIVNYAHVLTLIIAISYLLVFLIELILRALKKINGDTVYFLCYTFLSAILSAYFSVEDFFNQKLLFETPKFIYLFMTALLSLSIIFYVILRKISEKKPIKNSLKKEEVISKKPTLEPITTVYEPATNKDISNTSGYLDVSYVKSLINELKRKNLSEKDYAEVEDFELYLLNFISRQPLNSERFILNEKISMLIKKIAYYTA